MSQRAQIHNRQQQQGDVTTDLSFFPPSKHVEGQKGQQTETQ